MKRETSRTLPSGHVINHEYGLGSAPGASWHKVTTGISPNFRWTKTVFDGFGRTLEVISGYKLGSTETAVSKLKTEYAPCACSSIGKMKRTSMPYEASGSPAHWTVYEYDEIGRTVKVTPPGKGLNPETVTQVRTFTYNSGGQTTSISHPENGTVSFLYNPDGSVQRKTDAKSQRVEWTYTPEGRPATVQKFWANGTEDTCSRVTYEYGAQTIDGGFAGTNLQGRVASVTTGCTGQRGGKVDELYSYNVAGAVVTKRVRITRGVSTVTKDIVYTYDGEGKLASTKYPDEAKPWVMGYDAMARPNGLTQEWWDGDNNQWANRQWVNGVSYGDAGQLLGMSTFSGIQNFAEVRFTETREYNERLQMTRQRTLQGATLAMDLKYVFTNGSNPNNDGRIIQRENVLSGETVSYAYDSLQRLVSAETTSAAWGLSFDYDGFGNRWEQLVTKGTAPGNVVSFDQATNRVNSSSYSHDANGNMLSTPTVSGMTYDVENRLLTANGNGSLEEFAYLGDNKRVWKKATQGGTPVEQYYLYGVGGQRIATYSAVYSGGTLTLTYASKDVYFGGRVIWQNGKAVVQDRLGSVMARGNGVGGVETHDYYPYGEERTATVGDRNKFGTYHRDQTGLDYADQRYYNSAIGRFLTSDPYEASGGAAEPGSWGRGVYVTGDVINLLDPSGLMSCEADFCVTHTELLPPGGGGGGGGGGGPGCGMAGCLELPPEPFEWANTSGGGGSAGANRTLSEKKARHAYTAFQSLHKKLGELSQKCKTNVVDKLTNAFSGGSAFSLAAFQAFLSRGAEIWDGTTSNVSLAGNVTSASAAPGMAARLNTVGDPTVSGAFGANRGLSALASVTAAGMTIWVRPSEISGKNGGDNGRNLALLFHEGLHAFGGTLGGASYFDDDIQQAFFGAGSPEVGKPSRNISDYIRKNCF